MPVVEVVDEAVFEVWHDGILIAIVYPDHVLTNSAEEVDIVFYDADARKAWLN